MFEAWGWGWWNNNRRIISKYFTTFLQCSPIIIDLEECGANAEVSAFLLSPLPPILQLKVSCQWNASSPWCWDLRSVLSFLWDGSWENAGMQSSSEMKAAPHRSPCPPLLRVWAGGAVCAPGYVSPTRVWDRDGDRKGQTRRYRCADECGNMQMLLIHLSVATAPPPPSASTALACPCSR